MSAISPSIYEQFEISSLDGTRKVDIAAGVVAFSFFENLFSPHITAKVIVANTAVPSLGDTVYHGLPLKGGERVNIKIASNSENNAILDLTGENALYVSSIRNVFSEAESETFGLNLVSREAISNETSRVGKKFSQKISTSVKKIIEEFLLTEKNINIDDTENDYAFIGNLRKPFTILTWLASKSVPASSKEGEVVGGKSSTAGYFFYETRDGFNFRSIDALCTQEPVGQKYIYQPGILNVDDPNKDFRIIQYSTTRNNNFVDNLERGAYCTHRMYYNPLYGTFTTQAQGTFTTKQFEGKLNNLGRDFKVETPQYDKSGKTVGELPSRVVTGVLDFGTLEKKNKNSFKQNADPMEFHSQAMMRYNLIFNIQLVATIPLNTNLVAGALIDCVFPKITTEEQKEVDQEQSGLYMIKELTHHYESDGSFTKLKLIKDTLGKKDK
tara:strand:- start:254 stop:1576 length:1323 start_codon:yes stop_codon:yes gene_type:complete